MSAPTRSLELENDAVLTGAWPKWNPRLSPKPDGVAKKWEQLLGTHSMFYITDRGVLYDPDAWVWESSPTWYISGVSSERTRKDFYQTRQFYQTPRRF